MRPTTVSLFCGGGGESAGKELAFRQLGLDTVDMLSHAVNHWDLAVATHGANFPHIHVHQEDITEVTAESFGVRHIDLLWASPSCVHHSRARGGKPKDDQQRSHADEVIERWLKVANVEVLLIENVPEFAEWGPLDKDGNPIKEKKGQFFQRFLLALKKLGYRTEWRILCAADYGDPTIRRRFFMQAVKDGHPIAWPEPSHRDPKKPADLFTGHLPPWRAAAECIDWTIPCPSIFDRKKPLAEATQARIAEGIKRFVLGSRAPFLVNLTHGGRLEDLDEPFKTITGANRGEKALCSPTLVGVGGRAGQSGPRSVEDPMATATTKADTTIVSAFLAKHYGGPNGNQTPGAAMADPVPTITAAGQLGVVGAFLSTYHGDPAEGRGSMLCEPLPTQDTSNRHAVVAAFLQQYYSTGGQHQGVEDPLHAVTTVARHGLVTVDIEGETFVITDIGMRMLEPKELAKAMGFPDDFKWVDGEGKPLTKRDTIKMIGNACPVNTVAALVKTVVMARPHIYRHTAA